MGIKDKKTLKRSRSVFAKIMKTVKKPFRIFSKPANYFKGAWIELRQVRWPNRKATWGLTIAVILFSGFFALLIISLDVAFKYLFEIILK